MVSIHKFKPGQQVVIHPNLQDENQFPFNVYYPSPNHTMRSYAGEIDEIDQVFNGLTMMACSLKYHRYVWAPGWLIPLPAEEIDTNFINNVNGIEELI